MVGCKAGFLLHGLVHLLTDYVNETLKHLLDVDVVLGAGLEELKAWKQTAEEISLIYHRHIELIPTVALFHISLHCKY